MEIEESDVEKEDESIRAFSVAILNQKATTREVNKSIENLNSK